MKKLIFALPAILFFGTVPAQVGINTVTPNAQLEIKSTNAAIPTNLDGVIIPKVNVFATGMTAAQQGMLVYLTTTVGTNTPGFYFWDHPTTSWIQLGKPGWNLTGNAGTTSNNFVGTTDAQLLAFRTKNTERARIFSDGNASIGSAMTIDEFHEFSKLEIGSNDLDNDLTLRHSGTDIPVINIVRSRGLMKSPSLLAPTDEVGSIRFWGYSNAAMGSGFSGYGNAGRLISVVENTSGTTLNAGLRLYGSSMLNGLYVSSLGNIGIGTTTPTASFQVMGSLKFSGNGTAGAGKVMTSFDAAGNAEWRSPGQIASGTLDEAYNFGGAGVGKTITADSGAVTIDGTDGLVSTGTINVGATMPSGNGVRMIWNPRKAAFRAGSPGGTSWDDANTGSYSVAFGYLSIASGTYSAAFGGGAKATAHAAVAFGQACESSGVAAASFNSHNIASGSHSAAFNIDTNASGYGSVSFGNSTEANGSHSFVSGSRNTAASFAETVIGAGATTYAITTNGATQFRSANLTDRLFVIGNGYDANNNNVMDDAERSDAMVVLKNGNIGIGSSTPQEKLHIVGKVRIADGSQAAGRILVSDANGTGTWQTNSATNAWGLGGNASTAPATNFIGTTDAQPVVIRTNNTEKARIMTNGFVGLGTNDPDRELEVYGAGTQYQRITSSGTSEVGIELKRTGTASDWQMRNDGGIFFIGQSNDDLVTVSDIFRVGGSSVTPAVDNFVTLGQNALRWTAVHATNGVIQTSDANDKKQMLPLQYGLDKIKALRPVSFQWKDQKIDNNATHLGFVAQEVQKVLPEVVVDSDWVEGKEGQGKIWEKSERLGMKYSEIIPVLVKAFQEQQVIIEDQKAQLESQNKILADLLQRMAKLEKQ